jgi:imidazoleglycerol-phosphate dehydratase
MMQLQVGAGASRLAARRSACGGRGAAALLASRSAVPRPARSAGAPARAGLGVRVGHVTRKTKETSVEVKIDLDGTGVCDARSGIPFLDHMLDVRPARALQHARLAS